MRRHDTLTEADRAAIAAQVASLPGETIALVMALERAGLAQVPAAIASLRAQLYPHWRLAIAAADADVAAAARAAAAAEDRIAVAVAPAGDLSALAAGQPGRAAAGGCAPAAARAV